MSAPRPAGFWELAGVSAAVGGTCVWGLAAAARVGLLRRLLDLFPRGTWDAVTWGLIPALLLLPLVAQGLAAAALSGTRPSPWGRAVGWGILGAGLALAAIGAGTVLVLRRQTPQTTAWLAKTAPPALIVAFGIVLLAGWLATLGRLARRPWLSRLAVPLAAAVVAAAWARIHGQIVAWSYVLDRPEANGYFAATVLGGALGSTWAARWRARAGTAPRPDGG